MTAPERVAVALGDRGYDILIGEGLLVRAGTEIGPLLARPFTVIVTDETVAPFYLEALQASLDGVGIASQAVRLRPGEATKDFAHLERLTERLLQFGVERRDTIIALGGGVIGDLTGFAAAVLRRGVDFIQIPTSLLAQVDSSVGGKTGINSSRGKNLIGAFHQPKMVLADIGVLDSLPRRELLAGYAEVVKYGLLGDLEFFTWLEGAGAGLLAGDTAARIQAVKSSCLAKAAIVAEDERESGVRALLNLGHTFGHALEAATDYDGSLLHGEAVAIGMALAFELSAMLGWCPGEDSARVRRHLASVGLPCDIPDDTRFATDRLIDFMGQDKKVIDGRIPFILVSGIGKAFIAQDVDLADVAKLLDGARAEFVAS